MAKSQKDQAESAAETDDQVTTVKARQAIARLIRKIGALREINQEEVLDLFREQFEAHLSKLIEQQMAELKDRR